MLHSNSTQTLPLLPYLLFGPPCTLLAPVKSRTTFWDGTALSLSACVMRYTTFEAREANWLSPAARRLKLNLRFEVKNGELTSYDAPQSP